MKQGMFTIAENSPLTERFSLLRLEGDCSAIERPGQFVALMLPGLFLRRPFSEDHIPLDGHHPVRRMRHHLRLVQR